MLILTRHPQENIIITNNDTGEIITVRLCSIKTYANKLQGVIGIDAPNNYTIHREEVQERINKQQSKDKA